MNQTPPRRISRTIRYGVSAVLTVVILPFLGFFGPRGEGGETGAMVAIGASAVGIVVIAMLVGNVGFGPRLRGQYLEVTTMLGRQSLDLAALTEARWEPGRSGGSSGMLRLRDPITDVAITLPVAAPVREAIRDGLHAAGQRGVVLPRRVSLMFGLPQVPGAPRNGTSRLPLILAFLAGAMLLGLIAGWVLPA
ncbi:hypothetical protein AB0F43_01145 [Kribbella sp. NPDC023972]|uniref:hypothetical protein n=1 Tax=Kribbella sp. NPDC023972 TaxID=3154795 RepID=UPI00340B29C0